MVTTGGGRVPLLHRSDAVDTDLPRTAVKVLVALLVMVLALVPTAALLWYAHERNRADTREVLNSLALAVLDRAEEVFTAAEIALADLRFDANQGCGERLIIEMRRAAHHARWVELIGFANPAGETMCTIYGMVEPPTAVPPIPPPGRGPLVLSDPIENPYLTGTALVAAHHIDDGSAIYAMLITADLVEPARLQNIETIGMTRILGRQGRELARLGYPSANPGDRLVHKVNSALYPIVVEVQMPSNFMDDDWTLQAVLFGSLGLVATLSLLGVLALAMRQWGRA